MEDTLGKCLLLAFVIMYVVSPIDAVPGPIDDIILILMTFAVNKKGSIE